jgi:hypothetical protein
MKNNFLQKQSAQRQRIKVVFVGGSRDLNSGGQVRGLVMKDNETVQFG